MVRRVSFSRTRTCQDPRQSAGRMGETPLRGSDRSEPDHFNREKRTHYICSDGGIIRQRNVRRFGTTGATSQGDRRPFQKRRYSTCPHYTVLGERKNCLCQFSAEWRGCLWIHRVHCPTREASKLLFCVLLGSDRAPSRYCDQEHDRLVRQAACAGELL